MNSSVHFSSVQDSMGVETWVQQISEFLLLISFTKNSLLYQQFIRSTTIFTKEVDIIWKKQDFTILTYLSNRTRFHWHLRKYLMRTLFQSLQAYSSLRYLSSSKQRPGTVWKNDRGVLGDSPETLRPSKTTGTDSGSREDVCPFPEPGLSVSRNSPWRLGSLCTCRSLHFCWIRTTLVSWTSKTSLFLRSFYCKLWFVLVK